MASSPSKSQLFQFFQISATVCTVQGCVATVAAEAEHAGLGAQQLGGQLTAVFSSFKATVLAVAFAGASASALAEEGPQITWQIFGHLLISHFGAV